ncbi:class I SAM-dependent methyltransferase [Chachezhania antarctica]|uniref:class I SAM-dependent methyltransferase n=1 Tax=Chachezhania antarctica TaxID=2340860 RepID=UPI000EB3251C|nr:methyltransferase [Chachezhania antarctica]|tara:strand:- start:4386 stop:5444 length:1059 start_codon:yes stop_codon:yes gene_type:complete
MSVRLSLVLESGLALPDGPVAVYHPTPDHDLSALPAERVEIVQPFKPWHDRWAQAGYAVVPSAAATPVAAAIVFLPRARAEGRAAIAEAVERAGESGGVILIDGAKTDGIESILKEVRARTEVSPALSKAHGKLFSFHAEPELFADWAARDQVLDGGFITRPGVFSADGVDKGSVVLAGMLDEVPLGSHVFDLGAGWGYLSTRLLENGKLKQLDLVEADHVALDCARRNVSDERARFHWADATVWRPETLVDSVVMNPPFHVARAGDPGIGQAFVQAAAGMLKPGGKLLLVANRHLPYEDTLSGRFGDVAELHNDGHFKVILASRPGKGAGQGRHTAPGRATSRGGKARARR